MTSSPRSLRDTPRHPGAGLKDPREQAPGPGLQKAARDAKRNETTLINPLPNHLADPSSIADSPPRPLLTIAIVAIALHRLSSAAFCYIYAVPTPSAPPPAMSPDSPIDPSELETSSSSKKTASKSLPNGTASTPTTATGPGSASLKPGVKLPARIDVENIYGSLRESLGDDWGAYSDAVRSFFRGLTNRTELSRVIDPFLQKPEIQRLHNQFFLSVTANATREAPEGDVATWVSHQGKTSSVPKTASGDAYERRLKKEIMAIPARDRRRMKEIPEVPIPPPPLLPLPLAPHPTNSNPVAAHDRIHTSTNQDSPEHAAVARNTRPTQSRTNPPRDCLQIPDDIPSTLTRHYTAKQIRNLDTSAPPISAGLNKNWQNEVLNAYQSSLAAESGEYIDTETIQARCVPICYEEGISSNVSEETARFIGLATDFFVKDVLATMIDRVRLEEGRRVIKDDDAAAKNRKKTVEKVGGTISMEHLRLSVSLSDNLIRQMPLSVYTILGGLNQSSRYEDEEEESDEDDTDVLGRGRAGKRIRLDSGPNGNASDHMDVDGAVPDTVKWENPASVFLMECLSGH
ncbi:hypothetical protein Dda_4818 [Drechslerella dactyloides]|uniref:Transcriptional co-activator n=1 Tax=Drechslerella dactyloides TaxID=74499 RepID=A0AAD6J205_DREDA|nr:hypothetical protein Dda_4818 [Drechslerella dactyloides]